MGNEDRDEDPHYSATAREEVCNPREGGKHEIGPEGRTRSWVDDDQVGQVDLEVSTIREPRGVQEGLEDDGNKH